MLSGSHRHTPTTNRFRTGVFESDQPGANDQSGLYHAVLANQYNICDYLLNLKIKQLSDYRIRHFETKRKKVQEIFIHESIQASISSSKSSNDSFLDQLKSVFLDSKSYDPYYTINYSTLTTLSRTLNHKKKIRSFSIQLI